MKKPLAQLCYESYCENTGWKHLIDGSPLSEWIHLPPRVREAWEAVAEVIKKELIKKLKEV